MPTNNLTGKIATNPLMLSGYLMVIIFYLCVCVFCHIVTEAFSLSFRLRQSAGGSITTFTDSFMNLLAALAQGFEQVPSLTGFNYEMEYEHDKAAQ